MAEEKKFLGTAGVQRLIDNIRGEITEAVEASEDAASKKYVEQETGKSLVSDTEIEKLSSVSVGANKVENVGGGKIKIDGTEATVYEHPATHSSDEVVLSQPTHQGYAGKTVTEAVDSLKDEIDGVNQTAGANRQSIEALEEDVGSVDVLSTTNKTVVGAINEVLAAVGTGGTAAVVSVKVEDSTSAGAAKTYGVYQGGTKVGAIDIPKDMVVQSGEIVVDPAGQAEGTYIKLVLANATNDEIYVNVGTLVDIYKAQANATQIQLAIDSSTREISATVVAGSITSTELANDAVVTAKIADKNVTKGKLAQAVQDSLDNADAKLAGLGDDTVLGLVSGFNGSINARLSENGDIGQAIKSNKDRIDAMGTMAGEDSADYYTKTQADATFTSADEVDGQIDVKISALKLSDTYDAKGAATSAADQALRDAVGQLDDTKDDDTIHGAKAYADDAAIKAQQNAIGEQGDTKDVDTIYGAKAYADSLNTAMDSRVDALESVTYTEITADDIDTMFND